jgi:hypothetical protein
VKADGDTIGSRKFEALVKQQFFGTRMRRFPNGLTFWSPILVRFPRKNLRIRLDK